jgi:hypothetical protein
MVAGLATAGVLQVLLDVPGAAADESFFASREFDHTFRDTAGATVTCQVVGSSQLSRPNDEDQTFDGVSGTGAFFTGDPACDAAVRVRVAYKGPNGVARLSEASGPGSVGLFNDDVVTDYVATHEVQFLNCFQDCRVTFQTKPK